MYFIGKAYYWNITEMNWIEKEMKPNNPFIIYIYVYVYKDMYMSEPIIPNYLLIFFKNF